MKRSDASSQSKMVVTLGPAEQPHDSDHESCNLPDFTISLNGYTFPTNAIDLTSEYVICQRFGGRV